LDLRIYPRHNIYLSNDNIGGLVLDARISHTHGEQYCGTLGNAEIDVATKVRLNVVIFRGDTGQTLVERVDVPVNATGVEVQFRLTDFVPRMEPYEILMRIFQLRCARTYQASTKLYRLPAREDGGSTARLDHKYGSIAVSHSPPNEEAVWKSLFPYSFYVDWGNFLGKGMENLVNYASYGYNVIHPTPGGGPNPWGDEKLFDAFLDKVEELGLYVMYDMRWTYMNLTSVRAQVSRLKARKSILTWYTADEPDGSGDPLNATSDAYEAIRELDPYHPVSLVLNCDDYHYKEHSAGADIILTDPYPVGINATFSTVYQTVCNATYGDCGCDNCRGNFQDVSRRVDVLRAYQDAIATEPPKAVWGVPQAFGGSEYWSRRPTAAEEAVLAVLFVNHGATGLVAWNYPTSPELAQAAAQLARALSSDDATAFTLGARAQRLTMGAQATFDAAAWRIGKQVLMSVVHLQQAQYTRELRIGLGLSPKAMKTLWPPGGENWVVDNKSISRLGMGPLEVNVFLLETE
jgi:hypothetical protein